MVQVLPMHCFLVTLSFMKVFFLQPSEDMLKSELIEANNIAAWKVAVVYCITWIKSIHHWQYTAKSYLPEKIYKLVRARLIPSQAAQRLRHLAQVTLSEELHSTCLS